MVAGIKIKILWNKNTKQFALVVTPPTQKSMEKETVCSVTTVKTVKKHLWMSVLAYDIKSCYLCCGILSNQTVVRI